MSGPNFVRYIGPVHAALERLGGSGRPAEVREIVAEILSLPDDVLDEQSSGGNNRYDNQVAWARFYLAKAGYIDSSRRGVWTLTDKGLAAPDFGPSEALQLFKDVHAEFGGARDDQPSTETIESGEVSPEQTEEGVASHWRQQLLSLIHSLPAAGFERLCQRLLRESGFEHVSITGRSGDGGIDGIGILQVNPLVSFKVLFQCCNSSPFALDAHPRKGTVTASCSAER